MPKITFSKTNAREILNIWWVGLFLFTLAIAAPWVNTSISNHGFVKSYVALIGSGLLFTVVLYFQTKTTTNFWKISHTKIILLIFFLFGTLSIFWAVNTDFSIAKWLLWLGATLSFLVALSFSIHEDNLIKLSWGLIISASSIAIIGILQYLFDLIPLVQHAAPASTFGNKNMATQPLVLILPLSVFLLLSKQLQGLKVWGITTLVSLILVYVIYTTTRAVWLSISVEIVLVLAYLIFNKSKFKQRFDWNPNKRNASLFAVVLVLILINLSADGFINFLTVGSDTLGSIVDSANNTISPRYLIW